MIEFVDPPKPTKVRGVTAETKAILDALKSRPGVWALIKKDASTSAVTHWGRRDGVESKGVTAGKTKGRCDVYARWVGES